MSISKIPAGTGAVRDANGGTASAYAHFMDIALSHIADFAYVFDLEGRFAYVNKALLDLWGLSLEQAVGKNFFDLQYPQGLAATLQRQIQQVIDTRQIVVDETPYTSPTGVEGYYEYIFNPVFSADGSVEAVVGSTRLITERKRADDAARRLAAIVESSQDAIISKSLDGVIMSWNQAATALFGYMPEEVIGQHITILIPPERHNEEPGILDQIRQGKRINHYETIRRRKDGSLINVSLTVSPIKNEHGEIIGVSKIARDITERKVAEQELKLVREQAEAAARAVTDSANRFRLLAQVVSLQVWTATPTGELDWANQECVNYLWADLEEEILGNTWTQFVHPDDIAKAVERWQKSIATGIRYEVEFRLRRMDGAYRWFLVRAQAMRDADGKITRWFGTNTDIHDLKSAQDEAERSSRAKDTFLATLSHELRTPLTPVLMTAAALREDARLPEDVREQLGMMERNISLEARLIDDMLDLTRISRGQIHMRPQACDAHSLIDLAIEIVRDDAQAKGIKLDREFHAQLCGLLIDPARFQQVIWNLLRNAVKFTPRGGHISILTRDARGEDGASRLHIEVSDSGIGIDSSALDQIFLPFDQGGLSGDHRFGGVGLGLSIARAIVDLHGGTISAASAGPNQGATFVVELPGASRLADGSCDEGKAPRVPDVQVPVPSGTSAPPLHPSLRLLLVEDHESTLRVLSRLLIRAGHSVVTAATLADAMVVAAANKIDLVISDLGLPDGTGTELMERLRDTYGLQGIALSGYGMEDDIERSQAAGFFAHLIKPVDFHQLQRLLDEVVKDGRTRK